MLFYPNRIENICAFRIHKTEADILDAQRSIKQKAQVNLSVVLRLNHGTAVYDPRLAAVFFSEIFGLCRM